MGRIVSPIYFNNFIDIPSAPELVFGLNFFNILSTSEVSRILKENEVNILFFKYVSNDLFDAGILEAKFSPTDMK